MRPFAAEHGDGAGSRVDLSFLLERPAGRSGFVTVRDGRLVRGDGAPLRLWGVNITDWSPGSTSSTCSRRGGSSTAAATTPGASTPRSSTG